MEPSMRHNMNPSLHYATTHFHRTMVDRESKMR
jgi:hypothetical protein